MSTNSVPNCGHAMANVAIFNFKWPWVFSVHGQPYWTSKSAKCGHIWLFKKFWQKLGLLQQIFGHLWQILVFFEIFLKTFALLQKLEKYFLEFSKLSLLRNAIKRPFFVLKIFQKSFVNFFLQFEIFSKIVT